MKSVKTFFIKRAKAALHIITIVGISIAICACTNDRCTIIGNVTGLNEEGWILMSDTWNHYKVIDSVRHENGQFRFDMDKIDFETFVCLQFKPDTQDREFDIRQFILEPGELIVGGDFRSDRWSGVTGSPMNIKSLRVQNGTRSN